MKIVVKQEGLFEKKKSVVVVAMHDLSAGEVLSVDMAPGKLESQVRTAEYRVRGMVWNLLLGCWDWIVFCWVSRYLGTVMRPPVYTQCQNVRVSALDSLLVGYRRAGLVWQHSRSLSESARSLK